jgi:hypothetical protein
MAQHHKSFATAIMLLRLFSYATAQKFGLNQLGDPRNIKNGSVIPDEG